MQFLPSLLVLLYVSAHVLSTTNVQTIEEAPGKLTNKEVDIDFNAEKPVAESCDQSKTVCAAVKGHKTIVTINAEQTISGDVITLSGGGSKSATIAVKKATAKSSIGDLNTDQAGKVTTAQSFTAPFIVTGIEPKEVKYTGKNQTTVTLNGVLGEQTVSIEFTDGKADSPTKFTLKIVPKKTEEAPKETSSALMKKLCSVAVVIGLTMPLLNY